MPRKVDMKWDLSGFNLEIQFLLRYHWSNVYSNTDFFTTTGWVQHAKTYTNDLKIPGDADVGVVFNVLHVLLASARLCSSSSASVSLILWFKESVDYLEIENLVKKIRRWRKNSRNENLTEHQHRGLLELGGCTRSMNYWTDRNPQWRRRTFEKSQGGFPRIIIFCVPIWSNIILAPCFGSIWSKFPRLILTFFCGEWVILTANVTFRNSLLMVWYRNEGKRSSIALKAKWKLFLGVVF